MVEKEAQPMTKNKEQIVSFTLRLPKSLWKEINAIASSRRLSMSQAVVQAVDEYVKREGSQS